MATPPPASKAARRRIRAVRNCDSCVSPQALFLDRFTVTVFNAMAHWPIRKISAAMLAVLVTLGLSLSLVQANDMAAKMSMGAEMAASGHCDRHPCDLGGAGKAKAACCATACALVAATLPQASLVTVARIETVLPRPADELWHGGKPPPIRRPPKTF